MQQRMQHAGKAVTEYRIEKQDRNGIMPEARESYDKLSVILICLNEEKDPGERGSLYRFLNTLLSFSLMPEEKEHILKEEYGISMEMKIREELEAMCNLSEAIEERGVERGSFIAFSSLVRDGLLRTDEAARRMKMSEEDFVARMREERENKKQYKKRGTYHEFKGSEKKNDGGQDLSARRRGDHGGAGGLHAEAVGV